MADRGFTGDDEAFMAFVLRQLDGATTPEEDQILNAELARPEAGPRRDLYVRACRQTGLLREAAAFEAAQGREPKGVPHAGAGAGLVPRRVLRRRRFGSWKGAAVGAAAAILAGFLGFHFFTREDGPPIAWLEVASGAAYRLDESPPKPLESGAGLRPGDGLRTERSGRVVFRFEDGTRVEVMPASQIRGLRVGGGKGFDLVQGQVRADVTRQPADRPMTVQTSEGDARVLGTRFLLEATEGSTRLEVEKGVVRLSRRTDQKSADVGPGQFAVASSREAPVARPKEPPASATDAGRRLVDSMAPRSWKAAPETSLLKAAPGAAGFPAIQGRMGAEAVVSAWSGAVLDTRRVRLVLWGGGHSNYFGNELYAFDLGGLSWERLTEPCPAPRLNEEFNADGSPNARATYNGLAFLSRPNRLFSFGGSIAGNGFASCRTPLTFDFERREWTRRSPSGPIPPADLGAACAYDPATDRLWWAGSQGLYSYEVDSDRWSRHALEGHYYQTAAFLPKHGLLILVGEGKVYAYDLRAPAPIRQAWDTRGGEAFLARANPGLDYDPVADRVVGWAGGAVYALDPQARIWSSDPAPGAPPPTPNGIFGRFRYVPSLDAFVVVTSAGGNVWFYKPAR